jgi:hypothetical protein
MSRWAAYLRRRLGDAVFRFRLKRQIADALRHLPDLDRIRQERAKLRRPERRLVLAVVGGYPITEYIRLGYDSVATYYNPMLLFDEVHYFQDSPPRLEMLDLGYPMHVHGFKSADDVAAVGRSAGFSVLRAYDAVCAPAAIEAAKCLGIPVVVSLH